MRHRFSKVAQWHIGHWKKNSGNMKHQQSQGSSNKPNAWSKPLQSKKGGGAINTDTPSTPPSDLPHRGGGKAPPGFTKQSSELTVANLAALRERYLHLLLTLTGQKVTVTLQSGVQYTGVLHTATPFAHLPVNQRHKYVLKAVSVVTGEDSTVKPGQTVLLDMEKVVQLHVKSCRLDALVSSSSSSSGNHTATTITPEAFTDMEISGGAGTAATRSKELVQAGTAWTSAGEIPVNSRAAKLAGTNSNAGVGALKGSIAGWDQFKANEELFNVIGTYDETVYTTVLDHTQISAQARQRAELLAREIEGTASTNLHIAEERGQALNQDYDEEDRYSGVLKVPAKPKLNYAQAVVAKTDTVPPGFGGEANETLAVDDTTTEEPKPAKAGIKPAKVECKPGKVALKPAKVESNPAKEEFKPAKGVSKPATEESKPVIEESKPTGKKIVETDTESKKEEVNTTENLVVVKADELANPEPDESGEDNKSAETSKSKLNASAKSFSFNINAKTFTPGVTAQQPPPPPPPPPQYIDPVTGMPIPMMQMTHGGPVMSAMMPSMMNPGQYPGMRYPIHYPGMEHPQHPMPHMHQMHQQQPPPASTSVFSDAPSLANISDEGSVPQQQPQPQEGDGVSAESSPQEAPQQPPPPPPPQHHMPMQQPFMHYPVGYYNPAMGMHPQIHPQQFMHPHMAALMQRQMYPMQAGMPPNMMRAPPYYPGPNGPMPYPMYGGGGYGEEDGLNNNGRGRGRGGTRGGRTARGQGRGSGMGARIGGRGRHGYPYSGGSGSQPDSGRTTPQDQQSHATEHAPVSEEIASSPSKDDTQFRPSETAPSTEIVSSNGGGK